MHRLLHIPPHPGAKGRSAGTQTPRAEIQFGKDRFIISSANKTEHCGLPQWEKTDGVCMADFNAAFAAIDAALGVAPRIAWGDYQGTDTYGASNPTVLEFGFPARIVLITPETGLFEETGENYLSWSQPAIALRGQTKGLTYAPSNSKTCFLTWTDTGLSFYSESSQTAQLNHRSNHYHWVAIG